MQRVPRSDRIGLQDTNIHPHPHLQTHVHHSLHLSISRQPFHAQVPVADSLDSRAARSMIGSEECPDEWDNSSRHAVVTPSRKHRSAEAARAAQQHSVKRIIEYCVIAAFALLH